ncbi:DUF998 domain-containing protein [Actinokineospora sp.]|uniref:DUF998 domain-containing protein n=1 Tax=Actinokineospora sp. TaxID=1872133 RepID=UPI0040376A6A
MIKRWAVASATLAPVALIGGWTVAAARRPDEFDQVRDTISALAAIGAHERWVMTAGIAVTGVCHLVTAAGLTGARPAGRVLLAAGGVASVLVAALPLPVAGHAPAAGVAFGALSAWPLFARTPGSRAAGVVLLAALAGFGVTLSQDAYVGLAERVLAGAQVLWPAATAWYLVRDR